MTRHIARWESRSGKHYVDLFMSQFGPRYQANGAGGCFNASSDAEAIDWLQRKVDSGYFLPDDAKTPMTRKW